MHNDDERWLQLLKEKLRSLEATEAPEAPEALVESKHVDVFHRDRAGRGLPYHLW